MEINMNFGRDSKAILSDIKKKGMDLSDRVGKPLDYIDSMISQLRGNENVISYLAFPENLIDTLLLITDSGKLLCSAVTTVTTKGAIFDKTEYFYAAGACSLLTLHDSETLIREEKDPGFFGATYDTITMFFDDGNLTIKVKKKTGQAEYNRILAAKKKLMPKKPKATSSAPKEAAEPKAADPRDGAMAKTIKEIRSMHEDGLITKEEMLDLIKAALGK